MHGRSKGGQLHGGMSSDQGGSTRLQENQIKEAHRDFKEASSRKPDQGGSRRVQGSQIKEVAGEFNEVRSRRPHKSSMSTTQSDQGGRRPAEWRQQSWRSQSRAVNAEKLCIGTWNVEGLGYFDSTGNTKIIELQNHMHAQGVHILCM